MAEAQRTGRMSETEIRAQVRRGARETMTALERYYDTLDGVTRRCVTGWFGRDKRLPEAFVKSLPRVFESATEGMGTRLPPLPLDQHLPRAGRSAARLWLQPHLIDDDTAYPITSGGKQSGAVQGAHLYAFIFYADRRRFACFDREPCFITFQRHAFQRYATRSALAPERIIADLVGEVLPQSGLLAAQIMVQGAVQRDYARDGAHMALVLPLRDGLALGSFEDILAPDAPEPYGCVMTADRTGRRRIPLRPHPLTWIGNPDRHVGALVRTVVPDDMLRDGQARFRQDLISFAKTHADGLSALFREIWLGDVFQSVDDQGRRGFHPELHRAMLNDLTDLMLSPDGRETAAQPR